MNIIRTVDHIQVITFLFILGSFLAIVKLMPCSNIVNKATGQVCHPAEKKTASKKTKRHKSKWNRLLGLTAIDNILVAG